MAQFLPPHLRKYVVEQNYEKYTPQDQACWRYILRQLKNYLSKHAHDCYLEGLEKTGIEVERIPRISDISSKLEKFGWRALPVSGFIPPAAFMELQSLSVLPIASDMRSLEHLMYTPAPDIVHEAAGHAPILVHPEFAAYLKQYAQVAKKAILSKEDLELYEAIRELSDIKESPHSSPQDIEEAERNLEQKSKNISHVSEASELSRMNWWTAEYGLIGDMDNPKIFGAGLLSSVGESKWCLSPKVKKIPLSVDCIQQTYDITEPQPQLYVTPNFSHLSKVLEDMAQKMAFRRGGTYGLDKAIQAETVNTAELDSGLQISGKITEYKTQDGNVVFMRTQGPSQLCHQDKELDGHSKEFHSHGYSTPLGKVLEYGKALHELSSLEINELDNKKNLSLTYESGITVRGTLVGKLLQENKLILLSLKDCTVQWQDQTLFAPEWGQFDLAAGNEVTSVFGGPADRIAFGDMDDFIAARVPAPKRSEEELKLFSIYSSIRNYREVNSINPDVLMSITAELNAFKNEWLPRLEIIEICHRQNLTSSEVYQKNLDSIKAIAERNSQSRESIEDGLNLASLEL
ncbi:MAG: aromatic amino acid hydroxylase [Bdellovibrionia bacterium]